MIKNFSNVIFILILLGSFTSCGDLFTSKKDKTSELSQFVTCSMDMDAVSKIMTKKVRGDLLCLKENLLLFIDLIKSDRPGYLDKKALEIYLRENEKDLSQSTFDILSAMFDLSSILFGDIPGYIEKENVHKLADVLIEVNRLVVDGNVYEYYSTDEKISYSEHNRRKSIIHNTLVKIGELFSKVIIVNSNEIEFMDLAEKFKNDDNAHHISLLKNVLFLKTAILGGKENTLNSYQLKRAMDILGDIGKVLYDVGNLPDTLTEKNEVEEVLKILKVDTETVIKNFVINKSNSNKTLVTYDQILKVIKDFAPEVERFFKYKKSMLKVKKVLLGNENEDFTFGEIDQLLNDFVLGNLTKGVFAYRNYMGNKSYLEQIKRIWFRIVDLDFITYGDEKKHIKTFNRIVKNYRFYQGHDFSPHFGFDYIRNPKGLFDIFLYEDIVQRFFKTYGVADSSVDGGYYLNMEQLQKFMIDFKDLVEGEGYLLPGRAASTAETITIMTSLFHAQSNGDDKIEIPEFVEFIVTMMTSLEFSQKNIEFLNNHCDVDEKGRIPTECFRENFSNFLSHEVKNGKSVESYLPLLKNYMDELETQENIEEYIIATTMFSRACHTLDDGTEPPMREGDFIVTWAGLLVIEQSMLKFDDDNSGVLEVKEVDKAYEIYESAVKGLIPLKSLKRSNSFAQALFRYLVKYKRGPEFPDLTGYRSFVRIVKQLGHLGYFYTRGLLYGGRRFQSAKADRMTFASVLKVIAENSPANKADPYDCNFLR